MTDKRLQELPTILVVDDEQHMCDVCSRTLQRGGYDVVATTDPYEAERILRSSRYFDLLLTEIKMPGMSGLDLAKIARECDPLIGIIIMTGFASMENLHDAVRVEAADFLSKPFELEHLRIAVDQCRAGRFFRQLALVSTGLAETLPQAGILEIEQLVQRVSRILVVDDEQHMCDVCSRTLQRSGYDVIATNDTREAMRLFRDRQHFDLLLTDIKMPGMSGLALAKIAREHNPLIGVIIMTGFASMENLHDAIRVGAADFLSKPFELEHLRIAVYQRQAKVRIEAIGLSLITLFNDLLQDVVKEATMTLLVVWVQGIQRDIRALLEEEVVVIFPSQHIIRISSHDVVAVVPVAQVENIVEKMLVQFYTHPLVQQLSTAVLSFGWARQPYYSADELIEVVAHDLVQRRLSLGYITVKTPTILLLRQDYLFIRHRYENAIAMRLLCQYQLKMKREHNESAFRSKVDQFIGIVDHDLNSGLTGLKLAINDVDDQDVNQLVKVQEILEEIRRRLKLCVAWERSLVGIGSWGPPQRKMIDIGLWLRDNIFILRDQLNLQLDIIIPDLSESILTEADTQMLFVVCFHLLSMICASGATYLSIKRNIFQKGGCVTLVFEDDGAIEMRMQALQIDSIISRNENLLWPYQNMILLKHLLQIQDISIDYQNRDGYFQMIWIMPFLDLEPQIKIETLEALTSELEQIEHEIRELKAQIYSLDEQTDTLVDEQIMQLLLPYARELEHNLYALVQTSMKAMVLEETISSTVQQLHCWSFYCYLLVRNLLLATCYRWSLNCYPLIRNLLLATCYVKQPLERVNVHEQIYYILSIINHKINHMKISLNFVSNFPYVYMAVADVQLILMNVVRNAADFTGKDGKLHILTIDQENKIFIRITDTGIGIPRKNRNQIFELYFSTKGKGKSYGLGLYVADSIAKKNKGRISVCSAILNVKSKISAWKSSFGLYETFRWNNPGTTIQIELPTIKDS